MKTLEEKMAEALKGKFFWEPTVGGSYADADASLQIREAQRQFRDKVETPKKTFVPKVNIQAERRLHHTYDILLEALSEMYDVSIKDLKGYSRSKEVSTARNMLGWLLRRYNPGASLTRIGILMKRDHSTVTNMVQQFDKIEESHAENIKKLDSLVGYVQY